MAEPMDLDDFENKENSFQYSNVQSNISSTEKGYEDFTISELHMKVRNSLSTSFPMSKSFTATCSDNLNSSSEKNDILNGSNLTQSLNSSLIKADSRAPKSLPLQSIPNESLSDLNRKSSVRRSLDGVNHHNIVLTLNGPEDDTISLPSNSSSLAQTPEPTTPTKEIPKQDEGSPIMRGLKSVLSMFKSSPNPVPLEDEKKSIPPNESETQKQVTLETTQIKPSDSSSHSPIKEGITFKTDLQRELLWNGNDSDVFFEEEKIPIHKLLFTSLKPNEAKSTNVLIKDKLNITVESMDISVTDPPVDNNVKDVKSNDTYNSESESEFLDCETTFNKSTLENEVIQMSIVENEEIITKYSEMPDATEIQERDAHELGLHAVTKLPENECNSEKLELSDNTEVENCQNSGNKESPYGEQQNVLSIDVTEKDNESVNHNKDILCETVDNLCQSNSSYDVIACETNPVVKMDDNTVSPDSNNVIHTQLTEVNSSQPSLEAEVKDLNSTYEVISENVTSNDVAEIQNLPITEHFESPQEICEQSRPVQETDMKVNKTISETDNLTETLQITTVDEADIVSSERSLPDIVPLAQEDSTTERNNLIGDSANKTFSLENINTLVDVVHKPIKDDCFSVSGELKNNLNLSTDLINANSQDVSSDYIVNNIATTHDIPNSNNNDDNEFSTKDKTTGNIESESFSIDNNSLSIKVRQTFNSSLQEDIILKTDPEQISLSSNERNINIESFIINNDAKNNTSFDNNLNKSSLKSEDNCINNSSERKRIDVKIEIQNNNVLETSETKLCSSTSLQLCTNDEPQVESEIEIKLKHNEEEHCVNNATECKNPNVVEPSLLLNDPDITKIKDESKTEISDPIEPLIATKNTDTEIGQVQNVENNLNQETISQKCNNLDLDKEIAINEDKADSENISDGLITPPEVHKTYNLNFDDIEDPFATKTNIRLSPPPFTPHRDTALHESRKIKSCHKANTHQNKNKSSPRKQNRSTIKKPTNNRKQDDDLDIRTLNQDDQIKCEVNKSSEESLLAQECESACASESQISSIEGPGEKHFKNVFNLPEIDDKNFNPFATRTKVCISPTNEQATNLTFDADIVNETIVKPSTAEVDLENNDITLLPEDPKEVNTEDEDTVEGPFLDADESVHSDKGDDDNIPGCSKNDFINFQDLPKEQVCDNGEMFIDAEAFEFLLNQNQCNTVIDSGKESLFLKFDPLFVKRISNDGIMATINTAQKGQSTPKKAVESREDNSHCTNFKDLHCNSETMLPNDLEDSNEIQTKPTMIVNPAVNSIMSPRKSVTPPRINRQSLTFTSPAMAVIDKLLSLSGNINTTLCHEPSFSPERSQQRDTDIALTHLREMLAEKEIHVQTLRDERKELQDRMVKLETQVKDLEFESQGRLERINDLDRQLSEKIKINKTMANVVEEYERTIATLVAELEQDRKRNAEERMMLIKERDEQTAHLASMEISFNDLHSKYEKSKQIIFSLKENEDSLKKSVQDFENSYLKMVNNYEVLKQHATSKLNHANEELEKMKKAHEAEVLKLNAMIKRKDLHITSLEETLAQKSKANEELTAICDELINKVGVKY